MELQFSACLKPVTRSSRRAQRGGKTFLCQSKGGQSSPWGARLYFPRERLSPKDSWRRFSVMANGVEKEQALAPKEE